MKKFSLKVRLILAFLGVASLLLVIGIGVKLGLTKVRSSYQIVLTIAQENLNDIASMKSYVESAGFSLELAKTANDERDLPTLKHAQQIFQSSKQKFGEIVDLYKSHVQEADHQALFQALLEKWSAFEKPAQQIMADGIEGRLKLADLSAKVDEVQMLSLEVDDAFRNLKDYEFGRLTDANESSTQMIRNIDYAVIGSVVFSFLIALILGFFISNRLTSQLQQVSEALRSGSEILTTSAQEVKSASDSLSSTSSASASSLEETVASLEEINSMVQRNTENSANVVSLSQKSSEIAGHGNTEVEKLKTAIEDISTSSKKISEIINVINDIAFQTNLLALNAAVEAARAGEQGKGFAVVADAVRSLSIRSAESAKDIAALIGESATKVEQGCVLADSNRKILRDVHISVQKVNHLNNEIATASSEQKMGLEQVSKAMTQIDGTVQSNAATAEEIAASSSVLNDQARQLSELLVTLQGVIKGSA